MIRTWDSTKRKITSISDDEMKAIEDKARSDSRKWIGKPSPKAMHQGKGWFGEMNRAWTDGEYAVMARTIESKWGLVDHACIRNIDNADIPWRDKQRIKNELFGVDRVAVEVLPPVSELVDDANMYHIWVLPKGAELGFTLKEVK